jgi:hypothetical protein
MKLARYKNIVLLFLLGLLLLIAFVHNPMSGYIKENTVDTSTTKLLLDCSEKDKEAYRKTLTAFYASEIGKNARTYADANLGGYEKVLEDKVQACHIGDAGIPTDASVEKIPSSSTTPLAFAAWHTTAPKLKWLGNIMHAIYLSSATISIGILLLIFF